MSIVDGELQLPSEVPNTGQLADQSEITRADGTVVIRQRVNISDPEDPDRHVRIDENGSPAASQELLQQLLDAEKENTQRLDKIIKLLAIIANVNPDTI